MKAYLTCKDRDFDPSQALARRDKYRRGGGDADMHGLLPWNVNDLTQDLGIDVLSNVMAGGDEFMLEVAKVGLLSGGTDPETIRYRQRVFADCLKNEPVVRALYGLATEAVIKERSDPLWFFTKRPTMVLHRSVEVLRMFMDMLRRLRTVADEHADDFRSDGFTRFFAMLGQELTDAYFAEIGEHLQRLRFKGGVPLGAGLGPGNKGRDYMLRKPAGNKRGWLGRLLGGKPKGHTWQIDPRDETGSRTLSGLMDTGLGPVSHAADRSADHILGFFNMLRTELAFHIGFLNLRARLLELGMPVCDPVPEEAGSRKLSFTGLYDVSLALSAGRAIVGNDADADGKDLCMITGANTGGKSTFLRSIGLAQLMMQAGMFAPADAFRAEVVNGIFTHYRREEDRAMKSGKWDEEMIRMSAIIDRIRPGSLMLFNESFAATNEREGAEIAGQITHALLERKIKVFHVTHLNALAQGILREGRVGTMFLRAERRPDGTRPFKLVLAGPLETSYGGDLYEKIFAE